MTQTAIHRTFAPFKKYLPSWIHNRIRSIGTAFLGPILFGYKTGYFLSSFKMAAVSRNGEPLPWYTYPSIDFLKYRNFDGKIILEFGGGQSTLWWAKRAKHVVTLEGDMNWYKKIRDKMSDNVHLYHVSTENREITVAQVNEVLGSEEYSTYDVIVIDSFYRYEMIPIALRLMAEDGIIICDNAEGYGFYEGFKETGLNRVDFFGNCPGVVLPHCTSIYFKSSSFVLSPKYPIPVLATEK